MSNYIYKKDVGEELYHHGVKGQVHGVRNYQYKDGSLTPEGRVHYGVGPARGTRGGIAKPTDSGRYLSNNSKNGTIRRLLKTYDDIDKIDDSGAIPTASLKRKSKKEPIVNFPISDHISVDRAHALAQSVRDKMPEIKKNAAEYLKKEIPDISDEELQKRTNITRASVFDEYDGMAIVDEKGYQTSYDIDPRYGNVIRMDVYDGNTPKTKGLIRDMKAKSTLSPIDYKDYKADEKVRKKRARELAAETNTLKNYGVSEQKAREAYTKANKDYSDALASSSGFLGLKAREKAERVNAAQANLDSAAKTYNSRNSDLSRITDRVQAESDNYINHVNTMISRYGNDVVKDVKTKTIKLGQNIVQSYLQSDENGPSVLNSHSKRTKIEVADPGFTIANAPVIGPKYSANVSAKNDWENRQYTQQRANEARANSNTNFLNDDTRYIKKKR